MIDLSMPWCGAASSILLFPGHQYRLAWRREEGVENWYYSVDLDKEDWLCPALFRSFSVAPTSLYAQVKARV
jgi:hypothetical protein